MSDDIRERVTRLEEQYISLKASFESFQDFCLRRQEKEEKWFSDIREQIQLFANEQYHDLLDKINEARRMRRQPLGRKEWAVILTTLITSLTTIILHLIDTQRI
jgi:hypothetical protein